MITLKTFQIRPSVNAIKNNVFVPDLISFSVWKFSETLGSLNFVIRLSEALLQWLTILKISFIATISKYQKQQYHK